MTAILPKELLTATLGGLSLLVVSGGSDGDVLVQQSDGTYAPETLVTGDVFGPASSTDNAIARFDATTGKLLQNCVVTIGDTGNIAGLGTVSCGAITASGTVTISATTQLALTNSAGVQRATINDYGSSIRFQASSSGYPIHLQGNNHGIRVGNGTYTVDIKPVASNSVIGFYTGQGTTAASGALADIACGAITTSGNLSTAGDLIVASGSTGIRIVYFAAGVAAIYNQAGSDFGRLMLGGTGTSHPSIKRSGATVAIRLADDSADGNLTAAAITASGLMCAGTYTVATLPSAAANAYKFATVSDSSVTTFGSTVAGSGSSKVMVFSNGTNWTVCGI